MIGHHENCVSNGYDRLLPPRSSREPLALCGQVGVLSMGGRLRRFDQGRPEPRAPLARPATAAFPSALIVSWAHSCPRGEMPSGWKARHLCTNFGHQHLCSLPPNAWDRIQSLGSILKRTHALPDLCAHLLDGFFHKLDVRQLSSDQETLVLPDPSHQGPLQLGNLLPQAPFGQLCHSSIILPARDESLQHGAPRGSYHVRGHHSQLDVSPFTRLL